jgi:transposase
MNTYSLDVLGRQRRRRYPAQFKATVVEQCQRPGVSIAAIALSHGLNANMVRK